MGDNQSPEEAVVSAFGWKIIGAIVLFAIVAVIGVLIWRHFQSALPDALKPVPVHQPVAAKLAAEVVAQPVEHVAVPKLTVYTAPAKKRLHLAPKVQADTHEHVVSAVTVKADDHPQTVVSVVNDQTGQTETTVQREPLPWLALDFHGDLQLSAGYTTDGVRTGRVEVWQNVFDVKAAHFGAVASCDQPLQPVSAVDRTRCYAGIGMRLVW